jgi:hypothetical protein
MNLRYTTGFARQQLISSSPVTFRAVGIGLAGVGVISALTPYNDFALNNTFMTGNFLPVGLLLLVLLVVVAINAPLQLVFPARALRGGELAVALAMMLAGCTLPSSGLMRYLPPMLVGSQTQAGASADFRRAFEQAGLPPWVLPSLAGDSLDARLGDPVLTQYAGRTPRESAGEYGIDAVPWSAWARPAVAWGAFLFCLYGALFGLTLIVRRQWADNERLAFPLATVYLALIEPPDEGRLVNRMFRSRGFWVAFGAVFLVHAANAMHQYAPTAVPEIPLRYNLASLFTSPPLNSVDGGVKSAQIYFCMIGIAYFLHGGVAFSLWFVYLLTQVVRVVYPGEITVPMRNDQAFGGMLVFAAAVLWVGRRHWWMVLRQMAGRSRDGDPVGGYLPYAALGWGTLACLGGLLAWLLAAGMTIGGAVTLVGLMVLVLMAVARIVAETGLIFVQVPNALPPRPWVYAVTVPSTPVYDTPRSTFLGLFLGKLLLHDARESFAAFALTGTKVVDQAAHGGQPHWRRGGLAFVGCIAVALLTGYAVSGASYLWVEYNYAQTLDRSGGAINPYGTEAAVKDVYSLTVDLTPPRHGPPEAHSVVGNVALGAVVTGALASLRLAFAWWPLHPIGFLLAYTYPMNLAWYSLFIGWLAKSLVVKFGGSRLLSAGRPVFLGMVFGEACAAGFWLCVSLALHLTGHEFVRISLLPA